MIEVVTAIDSGFLTKCEVSERTQISLATLRRRGLENRGPNVSLF